MKNESQKRLAPLGFAAGRLHVPRAWLIAECEAGRLPHLKAGNKILVDMHQIKRLLWERAQQIPKGVAHD